MLAEAVAPTIEARTYDEICEESRTFVDVADVAAWRIGDNAIEALVVGGTLTDYAKDIRKPKGTVREFHAMSLYWDATARDELFSTCPGITRSHMRKVLSIKDRALGRSFVEHAARKGWTVDQFGYILKRYKSLKGIGRRTSAAPKAVRVEFPASYISSSRGVLMVMTEDWEKIGDLISEHVATVTVVVTWNGSEAQ